jgi:hypothetical protein
MKVCSKCKIEKDESEFNKNKDKPRSYCKLCQKSYREANREKILAYKKQYNDTHKAEIKVYRDSNKEKHSAYLKEYNIKNRSKLSAYKMNWERMRRATDPAFRLTRNLRLRTYHALNGTSKSAPTLCLFGCTIEAFCAHIESLFTEGMTWDNYGKYGWHLDHIKPCSSFNLKDPEQQLQCFHWSNQQPLWAKDNLSKGAKWNP